LTASTLVSVALVILGAASHARSNLLAGAAHSLIRCEIECDEQMPRSRVLSSKVATREPLVLEAIDALAHDAQESQGFAVNPMRLGEIRCSVVEVAVVVAECRVSHGILHASHCERWSLADAAQVVQRHGKELEEVLGGTLHLVNGERAAILTLLVHDGNDAAPDERRRIILRRRILLLRGADGVGRDGHGERAGHSDSFGQESPCRTMRSVYNDTTRCIVCCYF